MAAIFFQKSKNVLAIQNTDAHESITKKITKGRFTKAWTGTWRRSFPAVAGASAVAARAPAASADVEAASLRTMREGVPSAGAP
jgi:hypothetical protein